jgi:DNA-binding protein H-NS
LQFALSQPRPSLFQLPRRRLTGRKGGIFQENEVIQARKYEKEQEEIKHIKEFIASCGTYANMMKQAKSKQKILDKMEAAGLTKPVESQVGR